MQGNPRESSYLDGPSSWTQAQSGALTGKFRTFGNREICADEQEPPVTDPAAPVIGNNGPIAFCDQLSSDHAFYRLLENDA